MPQRPQPTAIVTQNTLLAFMPWREAISLFSAHAIMAMPIFVRRNQYRAPITTSAPASTSSFPGLMLMPPKRIVPWITGDTTAVDLPNCSTANCPRIAPKATVTIMVWKKPDCNVHLIMEKCTKIPSKAMAAHEATIATM